MTCMNSKVARDFNLTETRDNKTFFLATTTTAKLSFARKNLRKPTLVFSSAGTIRYCVGGPLAVDDTAATRLGAPAVVDARSHGHRRRHSKKQCQNRSSSHRQR